MSDRLRPLIHVGYHKTGTTWLQRVLFQDPEGNFVWALPRQAVIQRLVLVNGFDFDAIDAAAELLARFHRVSPGRIPVLSCERLSGSPHSGGHDSKVVAERLAAVFPGARILVVVREQTSMLVSLYKEYVQGGGAASFSRYVRPPRLSQGAIPLFRADYLEYDKLIAYYRSLFDAEVLVLPYELLARDARSFVGRICNFVGAAPPHDLRGSLHVSVPAAAVAVKRRLNRWAVRSALNPAAPDIPGSNRAVRLVSVAFGARAPGWLRRRCEAGLFAKAAAFTAGRYTESNRRTSALAGIDLRELGYS